MLIWKVIGKTNFCNCLREIRKSYHQLPLDTGRKLNVHKTFRRSPGRFLNVFRTFNLCPLPRGLVQYKLHYSASHSSLQYTRIFSRIKSSMHYTKHFKFCSKDIRSSCPDPVITRRKLNVHSTFRRETINLPPVSRWKVF